MPVSDTTLQNGLRLLHEPMQQSASVGIELSFAPGSCSEDEAHSGLTHFCEHMVFKGTKKHHWRDIAKIGNLHGGELNAMTTLDLVQVTTRVIPDDFDESLELLVEMAAESTFPATEIERERQVILEEISEYEDNPSEVCAEACTRALFGSHALGRPVLGSRETVSKFTRDDLMEHWESLVTGGGATLSVSGGISQDKVEAAARSMTKKLPMPRNGRRHDSRPDGTTSLLTFEERDIEQVHFCIGTRAYARKDPRRIPLMLLDTVLGAGMGSRLFNEVREKRGLAYSIGSTIGLFREGGYLMIYGSTSPETMVEAIKVCGEEIRRMASESVPDDELEVARRMQQRNFRLHADSVGARCARNTVRAIHGEPFLSDAETLISIARVTPDRIREVGVELVSKGSPLTLSVLGPVNSAAAREAAATLHT